MTNISQLLCIFYIFDMLLSIQRISNAQYLSGSPKYWQETETRSEKLEQEIKSHADIIDSHFPFWRMIDKNVYRFEEDNEDYFMNVIFDPCMGNAVDCCIDTYGKPEYYRPAIRPKFVPAKDLLCEANPDGYDNSDSLNCLETADGSPQIPEISRTSAEDFYIDHECLSVNDPYVYCIGRSMARKRNTEFPVCWDHNDTIAADSGCYDHNGLWTENCVALGYTQTAYVVECGGEFQDDSHCGTFLEIHNPGDKLLLSEKKLSSGFPSGYRQTIIDLHYAFNSSRLLCEGDYEIWWVQRTKYDFMVEKRIPFAVTSPACDWDYINEIYFKFHSLEGNSTSSATDNTVIEPDEPFVYPDEFVDLDVELGIGGVWYAGNLNEPQNTIEYILLFDETP